MFTMPTPEEFLEEQLSLFFCIDEACCFYMYFNVPRIMLPESMQANYDEQDEQSLLALILRLPEEQRTARGVLAQLCPSCHCDRCTAFNDYERGVLDHEALVAVFTAVTRREQHCDDGDYEEEQEQEQQKEEKEGETKYDPQSNKENLPED